MSGSWAVNRNRYTWSGICEREQSSHLSWEKRDINGYRYSSEEMSKEQDICFSSPISRTVFPLFLFSIKARPFIIILSVKHILS